MKYQLIYTNSYLKRAQKFVWQHPELISQYEKTLKILEINPHHPSLRLHQLKGKLKDLHSVSINISYRITLEFYFSDKEIVLVNVGHHDEVYKPS
jgi:toxin HigB-1